MAFALVVVGASLGGLHALEILLAGLPAHFPLPVAIGQHRREDADDALCAALARPAKLILVPGAYSLGLAKKALRCS